MNKDKRALSEVVTTLIIILLVLVAIGIVWVVVNSVLQSGTQQLDISAKCLAVDLQFVSIDETAAGVYSVTLKRTDSGDDLDGVKIVLFNAASNSPVVEFGKAVTSLETVTSTVTTSPVLTGAIKMEYSPYFLDDSGNAQACPQGPREKTFPATAV